ncbi:MAG: hypothetical protein EXR77_09845 [Myxococcales bacterium]|nr:hypothetical protein [Myxococcales bacterium]
MPFGLVVVGMMACTQPTQVTGKPAATLACVTLATSNDEPSCRGGLLCEDRQLLHGFRVPMGCARRYMGVNVELCTLGGQDISGIAVREFLASRYPQLQAPAANTLQTVGATGGMLQVIFVGNSAQFTAVRAELPLAVDNTGSGS